MSVRLIAFDLDGTFLSDDRRCIPVNMEAVAKAARQGIHIVPCTGRMFGGMPEEIRALPFIRYGITMNGADVYDRDADCHIKESPMDRDAAEAVFDYLDILPVTYDCFLNGEAWVEQAFYQLWSTFIEWEPVRRSMSQTRRPLVGFRDFVRRSPYPVQKITAMFRDQELRLRTMADMRSRFPELLITSSLYNNMEVNDKMANKGSGLAALCAHLGIDLSEVMAFGDASNDMTMIAAAGIGVAMANAEDDLKALANYVTERDNNAGGVAEAIERFALH